MVSRRLSVNDAASLLGCSEQMVRVGIRTGTLPIGYAVKNRSRWMYVIPSAKFAEETGIEVEQ